MRPLRRFLPASRENLFLFLALALLAFVIEANPAWRRFLVYDRTAIGYGEIWRIWTSHLVHFGWLHFMADTGLFVILGGILARNHPKECALAMFVMPIVIVAALYRFEPTMETYGGLSGVNLGLLVFVACNGWQKNWVDWFWPSVLVIYFAEVLFEARYGDGTGGGLIRFDDSRIRVATTAHAAAAVAGIVLWIGSTRKRRAVPRQLSWPANQFFTRRLRAPFRARPDRGQILKPERNQ